MKFDFEKFKFYFLTLLATLFGTQRVKPIEIDIYIEDNIDPEFVKNSLFTLFLNCGSSTSLPKHLSIV